MATLLAGGLTSEAAGLIGRLSPAGRARIGAAAIRAYVAELPDAVRRDRPEVWLQSARASDADGHWRDRALALERAEAALRAAPESTTKSRLLHEVLAEQAFDHLREGRPDEAGRLAADVLGEAKEDEYTARSRALACAGRLATLRAQSDAGFDGATDLLQRAAADARLAGDDRWTAGVLLRLAEDAYRELCQFGDAIAAVDEALQLLGGATRGRALAVCGRADLLTEVGRSDEAEAGIAEGLHLGRVLRDDTVIVVRGVERA